MYDIKVEHVVYKKRELYDEDGHSLEFEQLPYIFANCLPYLSYRTYQDPPDGVAARKSHTKITLRSEDIKTLLLISSVLEVLTNCGEETELNIIIDAVKRGELIEITLS